MASRLTPRGATMRWLSTHRGCNEQPASSNRDNRKDGITAAQMWITGGERWLIGTAWCATWGMRALGAGGVMGARNAALAGVAACEDFAKAHKAPFKRGIIYGPRRTGAHWKRVLRGDGLILFGRGVHYETLRSASWIYRIRGYVITDGGNTTEEGGNGNQANGGTSARRKRPISAIYAIVLADFPNK